MLKLLRQLKPFTGSIIMIFLLLLGQAMCDLTLPDMMSRIINVGIQQNGIADATPLAIRESEMQRLLLFTDTADQSVIDENYQLFDRQTLADDEYERYLETYPVLAESPVYVLQTDDRDVVEQLNQVFRQPELIVGFIESGAAASLFGDNLPAGADPFALLAQLPESQREAVRQTAAAQISEMPESVVTQSNASYLHTEYTAVGLDIGHLQIMFILRIGALMLLLTLVSVSCSVTVGFLAARVAAGFGRNTRRQIFNRVDSFSNREMDKFSTASLITRSTNDIQQIQLVLVMLLRIVFFAPIMGVGGIIKALGQDVSMSWIIAAAVLVLVALLSVVFSIAIPKFRLIQKLVDKVNLVTREMLTGLMVVRAFNTQGFEEKRFDNANQELTKTTLFINRVMVFMMPAMMLLMNGTMVLIIWIGAHQIEQGSIAVGNMMAFMQYTMQIIFAFLMVSFVFIMLPRAIVSAQRISEVIETEPTIVDPAQPVAFPAGNRGLVEFQNVGFKYADADDYVLHGISFTAQPGQTTAIIGGTGSGKSTLINLVPRFYDVTEGSIKVDNVDVRQVTQHDLRKKIGYIPQKASLFSGTVESNIAYGLDAPDEAVVSRAAKIAQASEFINASADGYQAAIAQGGANLSGGQKQRLSIARALAKKPEIFIFDDSFSAIDFKTDAALRRALKKDTGGATILIVAQRINTIMQAEKIIALENGRMVGEGSHRELMESCQVYRELALSQLSQEELRQ